MARTILILLLATVGCAPFGPRVATYRPTADGLVVEAADVAVGERLMVFAGGADGPSFPRTDGRVWTTVRADPSEEFAVPVASVVATGNSARVVVPWSFLPGGDVLLQALIVDENIGPWKSRVDACVVLRGRGAEATVFPHVVALMASPKILAPIGLLVGAVLVFVARRRFSGRVPRALGLTIAAAGALAILSSRASFGDDQAVPTPLRPSTPPAALGADDALDRATVPGFARLLIEARRAAPEGASVAIRAPRAFDLPHPLAIHLSARLPLRAVAFEPPDVPPLSAAWVVGVTPERPVQGDVVLFQNEAGFVARRDAPTSRTTDSEPPK